MTRERDGGTRPEERLNEALLAYLDERQAGREPDREAFLAANADLRSDLALFIDCHEELARMTAPLRASPVTGAADDSGVSRGEPASQSPSRCRAAGSSGRCRGGARRAGRFPAAARARPRRHGCRLRGRAAFARRRVALKVLPFAAAVDARRLQRFKTEALAAANLQHERIVPVHAVGCERGVHYYAMQYIEGQSLAGLIAELRLLRRIANGEPTPIRRIDPA